MKVLEMIDLIEKHRIVWWRETNQIQVLNKITDTYLLEEARNNRNYILMLCKIKYKFKYLKDVLKTHSKEVTDKQILYYVYMCEQDVYVDGTDERFDNMTKQEMQENIKMMEHSCDRVRF